MALALYRKYRPRTFSEIIGQEHVTEPLSQALRSGRLHHAYLFSGPRGCGKTSSARILARSLNCEKGPTPDPCGECESCRALAPDGAGSIDVIEIDAASHGGVDDARDLRERAFFAPVSSRYKIYVIDEAHMVSSAGFNALLKLVEEPPEYVKFVFATTEPEKVLGTIKSRTHHYPFRLIPPGVLRPYLEQLSAAEGVAIEPPVFPLVVRAGGGSARDTLSVLDQLIAGAGPEGVTYARAVALLGVTDVALIDEVCDALAAGDGRAVYATIDRVAEAGHDARRFAGDLLERLRDLIVLQYVPDAVAKGLLDGADDELARMTAQASQFGPATLSRMADIVHTGLIDMRGTTGPRLVLELIAARMLLPGAEDSTAALLARMERMERRLTLAGDGGTPDTTPTTRPETAPPTPPAPPRADPAPAVPAPAASSPAATPATAIDPGDTAGALPAPPVPATAPERTAPAAEARPDARPGAVDAAAVRRIWDEVITMVRRKSPRAAAVVREATVRDVEGDVLVLTFKHAFHADAVAASPDLLVDAVYEVLGGRWQVRCEVTGQRSPAPAGGSRDGGGGATAAGGRSAGEGSSPARQPAPARESAPPTGPGDADPAGRPASGPGGATAAKATPSAGDDDDWPTPAALGGSGADGGTPVATLGAPSRKAPPAKKAPQGMKAPSAAKAPPVPAARRTAPSSAWAGGDDEPPYDPEFDPPVPADHVGFDPGDEPIDDDSDPMAGQTSEQRALDLLRDTLGAERIGDT